MLLTLVSCRKEDEGLEEASKHSLDYRYDQTRSTKAKPNQKNRHGELRHQLKNQEDLTIKQLLGILKELATSDPSYVCEYLKKGMGKPHMFEVKKLIFISMLENVPADELVPIFENLAINLYASPEGKETALALANALGEFINSNDEIYFPCLSFLIKNSKDTNLAIEFFQESAGRMSKDESLLIVQKMGIVGKYKKEAFIAIAYQIRASDPEGAYEILNTLPTVSLGGIYGEVFSEWLKKDPESCRNIIRGMPNEKLASVVFNENFINLLKMKKNWDLGQDIFQRLPFNDRNNVGLRLLLRNLVTEDSSMTAEMIRHAPDGPMKSSIIREVWGQLKVQNSNHAEELLGEAPPELRQDIAISFINKLAESNITGADEFLNSLSEDDHKATSGYFINKVATSSHEDAAKFLTRELANESINDDQAKLAGKTIGEVWSNQDRDSAILWAEKLPMNAKEGAYESIVTSWVITSPEKTAKWLLSKPSSKARDSGIRALIKVYKQADPTAVKQWEALLTDE